LTDEEHLKLTIKLKNENAPSGREFAREYYVCKKLLRKIKKDN